jgi:hypothetical protein
MQFIIIGSAKQCEAQVLNMFINSQHHLLTICTYNDFLLIYIFKIRINTK